MTDRTLILLQSPSTMAPLLVDQGSPLSNERFTYPLKVEIYSLREPSSKKRVSFDRRRRRITREPEFYDDEDIAVKWWSEEELQAVKESAKLAATHVRHAGEPCLVTLAHRKTSLMLAGDFKSLVRLSPTTPDHDLQQWCRQDDGRRGLERFSSRDYCTLRRRDILQTRQAVMEEQARQRQNGRSDSEAIARAAMGVSRRSRTFATFFGEADAKTARSLDDFLRQPPPRKRSKTEHRDEYEDDSSNPATAA